MCHLATEFCENRSTSFCVNLLTNKQTNADENITSLIGGGDECYQITEDEV